MSISSPPESTFLQLTSSSSGENSLCTWTETARALLWRSRSRLAISRSLQRYSLPAHEGKRGVGKNVAQRLAVDHDFQVHFGLALQARNAFGEGLAIGADGAAQRVVGVEHGAKFEGKHGGVAEALADHAGVLQDRRLVQFAGALIFADDDGEVAAGISQDGRAGDAFHAGYGEGPASTSAISEKRVLLGDAVGVPCHNRFSGLGGGERLRLRSVGEWAYKWKLRLGTAKSGHGRMPNYIL